VFLASKYDTTGLPMSVYCMSLGSFVPAPDQTYEVQFDFDMQSCRLRVTRVSDSGARQPEPLNYYKPGLACDQFL